MPAPRRLLMIAYEFPPSAGGGVARLTNYAKYLRLAGWTPIVLAGAPGHGRPRDEALLSQLEGVEVVRIPPRNPIWALGRITGPLRSLLRRGRGAAAGTAVPSGAASSTRAPLTTRLARRFTFPDEAFLWARHVERIGPKLCERYGVDAVLASGPPFSALAAGVEVGRRAGLPVVLDMRDQWRDNAGIQWPTEERRLRAEDLERRTLAAADAVVGSTAGIVREALEMGARRTEVVYNGFDPAQMPAHRPDPAAPLRIAFLGRFSRTIMDPTPFLEGFAKALATEPALAGARLEIVGPEAPWVGAAVESLGIADNVVYHGFRPYAEALELVSRADAGLMCVTDQPGAEDLFPGKLFDYIGTGLPLLFVGPAEGSVATLVREGRLGRAVRWGDVDAITATIASMARYKAAGEPLADPDPATVARFERGTQVARLAALLDTVV